MADLFKDKFELYKKLISKIIERKKEVNEFVRFLELKTEWLEAPASSMFHLCIKGGLLIHSVGVTETLLKLRSILSPLTPEESCIIVGLFHDVGKIGMPGNPYYIKNQDPSLRRPYIINPELVTMALALRSLYICTKYISLNDEEAQAIAYHDGQYVSEGKIVAHKESPLTLLIQYADNWTAAVIENGVQTGKVNNLFKKV